MSKDIESSDLSQRHRNFNTKALAYCYAHRQEYIDYSDMEPKMLYVEGTGKLAIARAKKMGDFYHLFYDPDTLTKAQYKAQKGKKDRDEIREFNEHITERLQELWEMIYYQTYVPGEYKVRRILEPKERWLMIAPFFPDRIIHHVVIEVLGEHWRHIFIENTYACIKGRGLHKCMEDVHKALVLDRAGTRYCLKIDIRKFYDNVDHAMLKRIIRFTISDPQVLWLLDTIIDSNGSDKGLPIGNFTSQYLANLYLSYLDHFVKEVLRVKYYYRYMDDMVVLDGSKERLHWLLDMIGLFAGAELKLEIKPDWQIFPVDDRSIDYVGFRQNHYGILLRKGILLRFYQKWNRVKEKYLIEDEDDFKHLFSSEYGWIIRCSEEHSEFILTKCINDNGKQRTTGDGPDCGRKTRDYRGSEKRSRHRELQPQHPGDSGQGRGRRIVGDRDRPGGGHGHEVHVRLPAGGIPDYEE